MLLNFFRWLLGYVTFEIKGRFPERFINIVTKNGLSIWDTKKTEDSLSASMYVRDYKNIRSYCRKSRVRLSIKKKHGLVFFIRNHRSRVGVLVGILIFISVVWFMSGFIWSINVTGLKTISYTHLMDTLEKNGLYIGTQKNDVSFQTISRNTMLEIEEIGWMAINVTGSYASVEIKEKAKSPHVDDVKKPANVKAKCDGLIKHIDTKSGVSYFKAGSAVVKDQLIVSSVVESSSGEVYMVRANAKVVADTVHKSQFRINNTQHYYDFSGYSERKSISVFNVNIPYKLSFENEDECALRYSTKNLVIFDTTVPVCDYSQRLYPKKQKISSLTDSQFQLIYEKHSMLNRCFALSECVINKMDTKKTELQDGYMYTDTYYCTEDIAYQQEIDTKNLIIEKKPEIKKDET